MKKLSEKQHDYLSHILRQDLGLTTCGIMNTKPRHSALIGSYLLCCLESNSIHIDDTKVCPDPDPDPEITKF